MNLFSHKHVKQSFCVHHKLRLIGDLGSADVIQRKPGLQINRQKVTAKRRASAASDAAWLSAAKVDLDTLASFHERQSTML